MLMPQTGNEWSNSMVRFLYKQLVLHKGSLSCEYRCNKSFQFVRSQMD